MLGIAEKELEAGKVKSGTKEERWYVWMEDGQVKHNVPYQQWLATLRFPRIQLKADTSYEVRPIDDCTGSGLNWSVIIRDKMVMDTLKTLVDCALLIGLLWEQPNPGTRGESNGVPEDYEPTWAKGDHEKAYRQWPVHHLVATLGWDKTQQCFRVYTHLALPFGAVAAVWHYTRITQGVCGILRRLFAIPQMAYVDDFLRCVPRNLQQYAKTLSRGCTRC